VLIQQLCRTLFACAAACALFGSSFAQDDPKETADNAQQAKVKVADLLATGQIVQAMSEKGSTGAKFSTKGRRLVERKYELIISELRQKHGLENWEPDETEVLIATRNAAAEFLDALVDARDNVRRKAEVKKKSTGGASAPSPSIAGVSPFATDATLTDFNKWRGDVIGKGDQFCKNLQTTTEEKDIRQAWRDIQDAVIEVFDRLHPGIMADKHVSGYYQEGLLQSWDRLEAKEDLTVRVPGCTKVQMVTYKIVDAYGTVRKGSVAIGLFGTTTWDVLKENNGRGGFYELVKVDP
jgi:hypothetical protein